MYIIRKQINPRKNWSETVANDGMFYHTIEDKIYWNESAYYEFDLQMIEYIEKATEELHGMCIELVSKIVKTGDYHGYQLDDLSKQLIESSWKNYHPGMYGRFDLGVDGFGNVKMFEYNADTPTSLLEASIVQWNWKEELFPNNDQFNSIHEKLIQFWVDYRSSNITRDNVYFTTLTHAPHEDWATVHYLMETASLAGLNTSSINLECIGYTSGTFVDLNHKIIPNLFKLYPWEWLVKDDFAHNIMKSNTTFIEPPWKMLLSNKALCVRLWEMFPNHPYLLEAHFHDVNPQYISDWSKPFLSKPLLGREGQGINELVNVTDPTLIGNIIQEKMNVITFGGIQPVIGSWIIEGRSAGIGIREDRGITTNNSQFVPHIFID